MCRGLTHRTANLKTSAPTKVGTPRTLVSVFNRVDAAFTPNSAPFHSQLKLDECAAQNAALPRAHSSSTSLSFCRGNVSQGRNDHRGG